MIISIIVAMDRYRIIGNKGKLPWHISADLKNFKAIIMGRKTHESIGRPLPGRENVIITRDKNYQAQGWYLTSSPTIAADWEADKKNRWLVPVGGGVGKLFNIGRQQMSAVIESYYHARSPEIGPDWQLRLQFTLLIPE